MKHFLLFFTFLLVLHAKEINDDTLKKMIGHMLFVGFDESSITKDSQIVKDINEYELGGVILFDKFYKDRNKTKNISSPEQLAKLTSDLKKFSNQELFISVDQEGGKVARLKPKYGFEEIESAFRVSQMNEYAIVNIYDKQSSMLEVAGITMNFAPVVDLAVNPKNKVIVGLERSFGEKPAEVSKFAKVVIQSQKKHNVISVLKHFPGHGSSLGDSHKGFVDVSETWSPGELEPYEMLIKDKQVDVIMTAHVFNEYIDEKYPATLSYSFNTELLRQEMGYEGVIISDDLQMGAISQHFTLEERVTLAINAGVDILLFGNQLENVSVKKLVNSIFTQVKSGVIPIKRIQESNARIDKLHSKYMIKQKPIVFTDKRKELTREYIKSHYGLSVKNIEIIPTNIVLHWTAVMDFEKSFERLNAELLYSDREDIAKASALNVSAHFLVKRDGTIYQLMPDNWMARHVIGHNYSSIGIENGGGEGNEKEDLTQAQLGANIWLVNYLKAKYPSIKNVMGHHEYRNFENSDLWLEKDAGYRTEKADPGVKFMNDVRSAIDE